MIIMKARPLWACVAARTSSSNARAINSMKQWRYYGGVSLAGFLLLLYGTHAPAATYTINFSAYTIIDVGPYNTVRMETGTNRTSEGFSISSPTPWQTNGAFFRVIKPGPVTQLGGASFYDTVGAAYSYGVSATSGVIHAWARNMAISSPPSVILPGTLQTPTLPSPFTSMSSFSLGVKIEDVVTVTSATLTNGTPVTWNWNLVFEGYWVDPVNNPSSTFALAPSAYFTFGSTSSGLIAQSDDDLEWTYDGYGRSFYASAAGQHYGIMPVTANVGDVVPISTSVVLGGVAFVDAAVNQQLGRARWNFDNGSVDMSHTAYPWADNLPAGVQITSASGYDYTTRPITPVITPPSVPAVSARCVNGCSQLELSWKSEANVNYQVQILAQGIPSDASQKAVWVDWGVPVKGAGAINSFTEPIDPNFPQRSYRVQATPAYW
jgi:hypothetical protein